MKTNSAQFKASSSAALKNEDLRQAMANAKNGFVSKRAEQVNALPEFEALRDQAAQIKEHVLSRLDYYLERYEAAVLASGGQVHWASDATEAQRIVLEICRHHDAKTVTKGKSMVSEEVGLNEALEEAGLEVLETDLGEYILQLAKEPPSHIIAPAVHKTKEEITDLFARVHKLSRKETVPELVDEARKVLREKYFQADVGITGGNYLIAETGSAVIVTNEGNGDLTQTLARVHITISGIERVVPSLDELSVFLRLLARSATGQETESYTTFATGARRVEDADGPQEYHVVLVDNGRSAMLAGEFRDMLRCIRCGACMNHCPVYSAVGGHAYGWVYPGPMGAVLTPLFIGLDEARDLPNACTLNGRCQSVCPVKIPLKDLIRQMRVQQHRQKIGSNKSRLMVHVWRLVAERPAFYQWSNQMALRSAALLTGGVTDKSKLPARLTPSAWQNSRDMPKLPVATFMQQWRDQEGRQ